MTSKSSKESKVVNFSQFIHPRNPYRKYDFGAIADEFLEFKSYLNLGTGKDLEKPGKPFLNWADRDAVRCLMKCCLKRDFGLDLEMPEGCLAPSLALKMNYLLWIEDMIKLNNVAHNISGIDIGTGGGIYFCSMAAKRFSWSMIGTETNFSDFRVAERNVERNSLSEKVQVIHNDNKSVIFPAKIFELFSAKSAPNHFCFTVCNPPFYEMTEVRRERKQFSDKNPGRDHEMSISGGEVDFIRKMIDQSQKLSDNIDLFSTLVGQKKSLGVVQEKLSRSPGVKRWVVNQFCQGKTMRWCLAWTYKDSVRLKSSSPISDARHEKKLHTPVRFRVENLGGKSEFLFDDVIGWMTLLIESLSIEIVSKEVVKDEAVFEFKSHQSNWRGQRAKRRQAKFQKESEETGEPEMKKPRIEREGVQEEVNYPSELLVSGKMHLHYLTEDELVFDMSYESGSMGKCAVVELSQFFKNRLNNDFSKEKCKNATK